MDRRLQLHALYVLTVLAAAILFLIYHTLGAMVETATIAGGKVMALDSGTLTGLTLMFREVLGRIQSVWEHGERVEVTRRLADSSPKEERPAGTEGDPLHTVSEEAGAAGNGGGK